MRRGCNATIGSMTVDLHRVVRVAGVAIVGLAAACASSVGPADGRPPADVTGDATATGPDVRSQPLGAQCYPAHPPHVAGAPFCGGTFGCFSRDENYVEIDTPQCDSRRCTVYHWDEANHPEGGERAFCSCRCAGSGVPGPFCPCPSGFTCTQIFSFGDPAFRGDYCVPDRFLR